MRAVSVGPEVGLVTGLDDPLWSSELAQEEWAKADLSVAPRSYWNEVAYRLRRRPTAIGASAVLVVIVLGSVLAPLLTGYNPLHGDPYHRLLGVGTAGHLLGTDEQGRDMFARLLYGGRLSLLAGFLPVVVATAVGLLLGMWAGLSRGLVNNVIMRAMDMLYAFPAILLAIAVSTSLGPGLANAVIATTIIFVPPLCRIAETATRAVAVQEYVDAARIAGSGRWRMVRTQIFPNVVNPVLAYASGLLGISMIIAASLSFLGLGSLPPAPEWGYMLQSLRGSVYDAALVSALPGFMIFVTSIAFNVLSDSVREAMDVRLT
jgi:peptide/nickel transport system permease protein